MAIQVPMPDLPGTSLLKGLQTGGNLFTQIMHPILAREQQAQRQKQFDESMKLRKAQFARSGANSDIQRAILQQQLQHLQNTNDPNYEIKQLMNAAKMFGGQGSGGSMPVPQELEGQGMGVFSPEGLQEAQNAPSQPPENGLDMEQIKSNPFLRGLFKKKFGFDPGATHQSDILHGAARDAADLEKLRLQVGDDSPVYQNAKAQYDAGLDAKKDLRDLRARTKAGLKPGETEFFDEESGEPLGKNIPLTAKERESEEGNILFNELYPYVYNGASPFSGEGSITRLEDAAANYKTDPKARKLFDDFLLAEKMLGATTVNEASTLNAGRTNRTYAMLKETLDSQDVPNVIKKLIKQYQIPASANLRAGMRYQKALSNARMKAKKGTPATGRHYYNPERQAQYDQHKAEEGVKKANSNQRHQYHDDDLVKVETPEGVKVMTYAEAKQLGAE